MGEEATAAAAAIISKIGLERGGGIKEHFVLVHGVGGGSWCWYKLRCLMENSGYKVTCIDLKGAGIDQADANSILSFDDYNKPPMDFMSSLPANHQVILVGHSAGGLSITQASHKFPGKVKLAVFQTDHDIQQNEQSSFVGVGGIGWRYGFGSQL